VKEEIDPTLASRTEVEAYIRLYDIGSCPDSRLPRTCPSLRSTSRL
jgi:hypothetical protein